VPEHVAAFARDFDAGCFEDLVGRLVPFSGASGAERAAHGLAWIESYVVA
jgi:hypothetical protein